MLKCMSSPALFSPGYLIYDLAGPIIPLSISGTAMKTTKQPMLINYLLAGTLFISSGLNAALLAQSPQRNKSLEINTTADSTMVYSSEILKIERLSPHIYRHISYLNTNSFGG